MQVTWADTTNVNFRLVSHRDHGAAFNGDGLVRAAGKWKIVNHAC